MRWLAAFLVLAPGAAKACATCKDAMASTPGSEGLARGFYYSIFLMLGVVFSLVGILIFKIVREARKGPPAT